LFSGFGGCFVRFFAEIGNFWAFAMSDKLAMLGPRGRAKGPAKVP
jgi:hypothetical protein